MVRFSEFLLSGSRILFPNSDKNFRIRVFRIRKELIIRARCTGRQVQKFPNSQPCMAFLEFMYCRIQNKISEFADLIVVNYAR